MRGRHGTGRPEFLMKTSSVDSMPWLIQEMMDWPVSVGQGLWSGSGRVLDNSPVSEDAFADPLMRRARHEGWTFGRKKEEGWTGGYALSMLCDLGIGQAENLQLTTRLT